MIFIFLFLLVFFTPMVVGAYLGWKKFKENEKKNK